MYSWIWRRLPGGWAGKVGGSLVLVVGAAALLFFVVFPWADPQLPFNKVTVPQVSVPQVPAPHVPAPPGTRSPASPSPVPSPAATPMGLPGQ